MRKNGQVRLTVLALVVAGWIGGSVRGAATVVPSDAELERVTKQLESNKDEEIKAAREQIGGWLVLHHCPTQFSQVWLPILMNNKRYQEVVEMSLEGALGQPYARNMAKDLDFRAQAYLALGKPEEALKAAKACLNVCEIKETERELKLMARCLVAAFPEDKTIERRFRIEQSRGSVAASGDGAGGAATKPASVLDVIKVDAAIFEKGLAEYKTRYGKFLDKMYYGNLLLASGDAVAAEKIYRGMFTGATGKERTDAAEAIARSLRAQDGNLGRANAWLASVPKEADVLP